ncbi:hypothetical protein N864_22625 [Intrasporangium chromatireducens Q5-1]|uniref:Uncharacterized protein n=1 Tax=Intrasporangium chromatireducens Q5-1 TaxID=584657 RepID=W9GR10_9MICO|nr:hypothetical protein [Intrasporangium chromatireducens]EWT06324.1 hypothetical protein N864_22625 [Intrasporangium chromatireducens Q5-1]
MRPMFVYPESARHALVRGALRDFLRDNGIPAQYLSARRGWLVRRDRLADLVARAERDGFHVRVKGADL